MNKRAYATKTKLSALGYLCLKDLRALRLKPAPRTPTMKYWQGRGIVRAYQRDACAPIGRYYRPRLQLCRRIVSEGFK